MGKADRAQPQPPVRHRQLDHPGTGVEVTGDDAHLRSALPEIGAEGVTEGGGRWRIVLPPGSEVDVLWGLLTRQNLWVRKLTHRRDTLEEIFLKAVGHISHTPGESAAPENKAASKQG